MQGSISNIDEIISDDSAISLDMKALFNDDKSLYEARSQQSTHEDDEMPEEGTAQSIVMKAISNDDIGEQFEQFLDKPQYIPEEILNFTVPYRKTTNYPDELLEKFVPETDSEKYRFDQQVHTNNI